MKGNVIGFDPDTNTGAISGHDGNRYDFATIDWHGHSQPRHGDVVDFQAVGHRATEIFLLEPEYVQPGFGQFYFSPRGRISRSQYWLKWVVPVMVVYIIIYGIFLGSLFSANVVLAGTFGVILLIFNLVILWPSIAILIKRIHDRNKSGWLVLAIVVPALLYGLVSGLAGPSNPLTLVLGLVMLAISIWFFVDFGCLRGTIGANQYGPDPVR